MVVTALLSAACGSHSAIRRTAAVPPPTTSPVTTAPTVVYPLTGLPATDQAHAARPALSVKIDNVPQALPQAGLNQADLVTDILVEGGLTRLMATFQSHDAPLIGPIRSARPVDADLTRELRGGIFAYSGAAPGEIWPSIQHSTALLVSNDHDPRWFWRATDRPAPHNVMSSTSLLYKAGTTLRPHLPAPRQLFHYSDTAPTGRAVTNALIRMSSYVTAGWSWNGHAFVRSQDGSPDKLADGSRVSATNVVILSVTWHATHIIDAAGNADPYVIVIGRGKAWVLRNGVVVPGHWVRPSYRVPMKILDPAGHVIALQPGRTWLELQPRPFLPSFS
jgi:hypothetical protein